VAVGAFLLMKHQEKAAGYALVNIDIVILVLLFDKIEVLKDLRLTF